MDDNVRRAAIRAEAENVHEAATYASETQFEYAKTWRSIDRWIEDPQFKWTPDRLTRRPAERMSTNGTTRRKFTLEFKTEAAHRVRYELALARRQEVA